MWQAISRLLNEQWGEGETELRTELPGGEIHAAWHLRHGGRDYFVKCDDRELLPIFTAEADQLELLSRSQTVNVPAVHAVGSDRDYSFLVMDYLPCRPLDAHNAFLLGQQLARLHQWSDQPQFGLDFDNDLSTTPQPNAWQRRWSTFFAEQRIGWQLELAAEKGLEFGNIDAIVEHIQQRLASHQPQPSLLHGDLWSANCALGPNGPIIFDPACYWGDREC
ncbi:fructosamine kinase family protein, partial [Enterobacter sp.]